MSDTCDKKNINESTQYKWQEELVNFCKKNSDINAAFSVRNNGNVEFIIVIDDVTSENVLSYNEFGFELRKHYNEIYDFMILDSDMVDGIESMFEKTEKIYERDNSYMKGFYL